MKENFIKILLIYMIALGVFLIPSISKGFEYEVDFPTSIPGKQHTLRITIDGCTTLINIKNADLEKFARSEEAKKQVLELAMKRTKNNCK